MLYYIYIIPWYISIMYYLHYKKKTENKIFKRTHLTTLSVGNYRAFILCQVLSDEDSAVNRTNFDTT